MLHISFKINPFGNQCKAFKYWPANIFIWIYLNLPINWNDEGCKVITRIENLIYFKKLNTLYWFSKHKQIKFCSGLKMLSVLTLWTDIDLYAIFIKIKWETVLKII